MVRVRIAPAPTGNLHLGTARTALFNYIFARHHRGKFILRIDDSDPQRSKLKFEKNIIAGFKWLSLKWDEGPSIGGPYAPYYQSQRKSSYQPYLDKLVKNQQAYECFCTQDELEAHRKKMQAAKKPPVYSGRCRSLSSQQKQECVNQGRQSVIRFKTRKGIVKFIDPNRGQIAVNTNTIGDFVLTRKDRSPLLVLATTIDDIEMKITHTIRGEDFLNLVPKQILLFEALDKKPPVFAHLPFVYGPDNKKLSKRHDARPVTDYQQSGYLVDAVITFLSYLGWSYQDNSQLLSMNKLKKEFSLKKVHTTKPIFDIKKLDHFNGLAIRQKSDKQLLALLKPFVPKDCPQALAEKIIPLIKDRLVKLSEFEILSSYFYRDPKIDKQLIVKQSKKDISIIRKILKLLEETYSKVAEKDWLAQKLELTGRDLVTKTGWTPKELFMTLRASLTGSLATPPLFDTMQALGQPTVIKRLNHAQKNI